LRPVLFMIFLLNEWRGGRLGRDCRNSVLIMKSASVVDTLAWRERRPRL
jgi:hypothetical protein